MINSNSQPISRTSSIDSTTGERRTLSRDVDVMKSRMVSGERQISISSNRPATTILATDHLLNPNHEPDRISTCCGLKLTGNAKTLLISTFLFLTITTGQYFAAIAASSIALKADCVSMLVDALSYIGNLFAECTPNPNTKKRLELAMSGVSFALLLYFTADFLMESLENTGHVMCNCDTSFSEDPTTCWLADNKSKVIGEDNCEPDEEVNAYIVLGFALGGLVFDFISLYAYKKFSTEEGERASISGAGPYEHKHHHHVGDDPLKHRHKEEESEESHDSNVNMLSALMHIGSDLLRSTTTFVESLILLYVTGVDSVKVDGWCALIVCSLIALGAVWSVGVWAKEVWIFCMKSEEDEEEQKRYNLLVDSV